MMAAIAKPTVKRTSAVECDRCGKRVYPLGLTQHKRGMECEAIATTREMSALGFVRTGSGPTLTALTKLVPEIDEMWCYAPTRFQHGYRDKCGKIEREGWAVEWLSILASVFSKYSISKARREVVTRWFLADDRLPPQFLRLLSMSDRRQVPHLHYWIDYAVEASHHDVLVRLIEDEELHEAIASTRYQGSTYEQLIALVEARVNGGAL